MCAAQSRIHNATRCNILLSRSLPQSHIHEQDKRMYGYVYMCMEMYVCNIWKCINMYGNVYIYLGFVYTCSGICMRDLRIKYGRVSQWRRRRSPKLFKSKAVSCNVDRITETVILRKKERKKKICAGVVF